MSSTKQVICNGKPFAIINGRRVWLTKPPVDVRQDIEMDQLHMEARAILRANKEADR